MRILVAFSDFGAQGRDDAKIAGLHDFLSTGSDVKIEWLRLPSGELSVDRLLFLRMLPVSKAADALFALDPTATVLRHSRKVALMLREPSKSEEQPAVWPILMCGLSESELILLPKDQAKVFGLPDRLAKRSVTYGAGEFSVPQVSGASSGPASRSLLKVLGS